MNTQNLVYIVLATTFFVLVIPALLPTAQSQGSDEDIDEEDLAPTGQVINSKYLRITGVTLTKMIVR